MGQSYPSLGPQDAFGAAQPPAGGFAPPTGAFAQPQGQLSPYAHKGSVCESQHELGERKRASKLKQTLALQFEPLQDIRKYLKIIKNNHSSN